MYWVIWSSRAEIITIDVRSTTHNNSDDVCTKWVDLNFSRNQLFDLGWTLNELRMNPGVTFYVNHSMLLLNLTQWNPNEIRKVKKGQVRDEIDRHSHHHLQIIWDNQRIIFTIFEPNLDTLITQISQIVVQIL